MSDAMLEHVNMTVNDSNKTADLLCRLFDWRVRWEGAAINDGRTVHVGLDNFYIALYEPKQTEASDVDTYVTLGGLNHIAVTVGNFEETEERVRAAGFECHSHAYYEPGKRFYFNDHDGIEYEVVHYPELR